MRWLTGVRQGRRARNERCEGPHGNVRVPRAREKVRQSCEVGGQPCKQRHRRDRRQASPSADDRRDDDRRKDVDDERAKIETVHRSTADGVERREQIEEQRAWMEPAVLRIRAEHLFASCRVNRVDLNERPISSRPVGDASPSGPGEYCQQGRAGKRGSQPENAPDCRQARRMFLLGFCRKGH